MVVTTHNVNVEELQTRNIHQNYERSSKQSYKIERTNIFEFIYAWELD